MIEHFDDRKLVTDFQLVKKINKASAKSIVYLLFPKHFPQLVCPLSQYHLLRAVVMMKLPIHNLTLIEKMRTSHPCKMTKTNFKVQTLN